MHEDTRAALKKAKEAAHKVMLYSGHSLSRQLADIDTACGFFASLHDQTKSEMGVLKARLEAKVDERTLQTAQEELRTARAEIRDLTEAIGKYNCIYTVLTLVGTCLPS